MTAYHDEIKAEHGRTSYLAHGVLFVPDERRNYLVDRLLASRKRHSYYEEVHAREIKGASAQNGRFQVAQDWIRDYFQWAIRSCPFKAFIVDYGQRPFPYPGDDGYPEHLLRSTLSAIKSGIAWSYYRESRLRLRIVYDDTDNEIDRKVAEEVSDVLPSVVNAQRIRTTKRYPWIRTADAEFVKSHPKKAPADQRPDSELIQLCDLLLGPSFWSLDETLEESSHAGRRKLAKAVTSVLAETLEVPWLQQVPVHRAFSVSLYPDRFNFAYPAALRRREQVARRCQLRLL